MDWRGLTRFFGGCQRSSVDGEYSERLDAKLPEIFAHLSDREVGGLGPDLLPAAAGADGLVVEKGGGIDFCVFVKPLGVNVVRKGGAGAGYEPETWVTEPTTDANRRENAAKAT
jgi:hypothetical protein